MNQVTLLAAGLCLPAHHGQPTPLRLPRSVVEALGTGEIPAELSAILVAAFRTVHKDGAARSSEKRLGRGIHSFLAQLALVVDPIHGLEQVTLVGVDPYEMVHFMHFLISIRVDI